VERIPLTAALLATALSACRPEVRSPEQCSTFKKTAIAWAAVVLEEDVKPYPHDSAYQFCVADILAHGYVIEQKPGGLGFFDRFTTTLPGQVGGAIFTAEAEMSPETACHERIHMYTELRLGLKGSIATYAWWEGRLAFELPAYGERLLYMKRDGASKEQRLRVAEWAVGALSSAYLNDKVDIGCLRELSMSFWEDMECFR